MPNYSAFPPKRFDAFLGWATDIGFGFSPAAVAQQARIDAAVTGLYACCDELIAQRRQRPRDDLISALIAAEADDESITTDELRIMVSNLVFAGQDTTRNQLGLAMTTFATYPEQWRLLAQRPELAGTAVEEIMRVNPTIPALSRLATEDFTFQGVDIPAGTHVVLFLATVNTDPPWHFRPRTVRHHRSACHTTHLRWRDPLLPRNWLARAEMREALPILASRLGDISLNGPIPSRPHLGITGPITLQLRFSTSP